MNAPHRGRALLISENAPVPGDRRVWNEARALAGAGWETTIVCAAAEGGLDFGRYAGWTIPDLAKHDPDYLEWLRRTPIGRPFTAQIDQVLAARATVTTAPPPGRRGWRTHR